MICPFCGAEQPDDKQFCQNCGKRVGGADSVPIEPNAEHAAMATMDTVAPAESAAEPVEARQTATEHAAAPAAAVAAEHAGPSAPKTSVYHSVLDKKPDRDSRWATIGTGGWFGILLLMGIPLVNLICVLVWSFGGARKSVKQSFARATLLWGLISTILAVAGGILLRQYGGSLLESLFAFINLL